MPESKFWRGIESKSLSLYGAATPHLRVPPLCKTLLFQSLIKMQLHWSQHVLGWGDALGQTPNQGYKLRTLEGKLQSG